MAKPEDYKHIAVWSQMMGYTNWSIVDDQTRAAADNAPIDSVYQSHTGPDPRPWITFSQITNEDAIAYFKGKGLTQGTPQAAGEKLHQEVVKLQQAKDQELFDEGFLMGFANRLGVEFDQLEMFIEVIRRRIQKGKEK